MQHFGMKVIYSQSFSLKSLFSISQLIVDHCYLSSQAQQTSSGAHVLRPTFSESDLQADSS